MVVSVGFGDKGQFQGQGQGRVECSGLVSVGINPSGGADERKTRTLNMSESPASTLLPG